MSLPIERVADISLQGIYESVPYKTLGALTGPFRSGSLFYLYHLSHQLHDATHGRVPQFNVIAGEDLRQYFGHPEKTSYSIELGDAPEILTSIDSRLTGDKAPPEHFIGEELSQKWTLVKEKIQQELDPEHKTVVSDYVLTTRGDTGQLTHTIFATDESHIYALEIQEDKVSRADFEKQMRENDRQYVLPSIPDAQQSIPFADHIIMEQAIARVADQMDIDRSQSTIRRLSPIANAFQIPRHVQFEREGDMFTDLRHRGAWSIGEHQEAFRQLIARGSHVDETGSVHMDDELASILVEVRTMSDPTIQPEQASEEMQKYLREYIYHYTVVQTLKQHPEITDTFIDSGLYSKYALSFKDIHLSSHGLSEREVAEMMIAGYYLSQFEGSSSMTTSPSQRLMGRVEGYESAIREFTDIHSACEIPLPERGQGGKDAQERDLALLMMRTENRKNVYKRASRLDSDTHQKLVEEGRQRLHDIKHQIRRNTFHQNVLNKMDASKLPLAIDEHRRKGLFPTIIANIGLATVPGERRITAQSWFPKSDGYLPDGKPLQELREDAPVDIQHAIAYIFNGATEQGKSAYDLQDTRIYEMTPSILRFLQTDTSIPENVREFMQSLTSDALFARVISTFGSANEQDPNIVNRFFPDGLSEFQLMTVYRYVFEFVRGVETQLIFETEPKRSKKLKRRFLGKWENLNFSEVAPEITQKAVQHVLKNGAHRIDILNHRPDAKKSTLKDWQEYFETAFGWDTMDMKFLRWQNHWNINHTLGGAWDCICFSRKGVFDPEVFQKW